MGCTPMPFGFICSRGVKEVRVRYCVACFKEGKKTRATKLCDYPSGADRVVMMPTRSIFDAASKTCDAPLCGSCAVHKGDQLDWCPCHEEAGP